MKNNGKELFNFKKFGNAIEAKKKKKERKKKNIRTRVIIS